MKILYLCSLFRPHKGGIETMVEELSNLATRSKGRTVILTKRYPESLPAHEIISGVEIFRFPVPRDKKSCIALRHFLQKYDAELKSDLIHIVGLRHPLPLIGWSLARHWNAGLIATICGGEIPLAGDPESLRVWRKGRYSVQPFLKSFDILTACSMSLKRSSMAVKNIAWPCVKILYAGIDAAKYQTIKPKKWPRPYILSLRRLVFSKGVDILLKSFAVFSQRFTDIDLLIAGCGPEEKKLKLLIKKYNLANRVRFIGNLELREAASYLKGAWCTVVPSRSEGGGLVNTEALAAGCPVIASCSGGIKEYLGNIGLFFDIRSPRQLVAQLGRLRQDANLRKNLVVKGKRFSRALSWPVLWPQYQAIYRQVLIRKRTKKFIGDFPVGTNKLINLIN